MEPKDGKVREFWDGFWSDGRPHDFWKRAAPEIVDLIRRLSPHERPQVLDLGCGLGRNAILFARAGYRVTAIDLSPKAVSHLRSWASGLGLPVETAVCNFTDDIFAPGSFDVVVSVNVLYHGYRDQCLQVFRNVGKWLRKEGVFYFTIPTRGEGERETHTRLAPNTYERAPGHIHYCAGERDLEEFLQGFRVLQRHRKDHHWVDEDGAAQFSSRWRVLASKV